MRARRRRTGWPPPGDDELWTKLHATLVRRLERVLRPLLDEPEPGDAQSTDYAAAVQAVLPMDDEPFRKKRLSSFLLGYPRPTPGRLALTRAKEGSPSTPPPTCTSMIAKDSSVSVVMVRVRPFPLARLA